MQDEKPKTLLQRLNAIMGEIQYIKKRPKSGLPYPFVAHDDVSEALRPLFVKHGVLGYPEMTKHAQNGNKTVLEGFYVLVNVDDGEDCLRLPGFCEAVDNQDKSIGKALSYFCKMQLLKIFQIPTGEKDLEQDQIAHEPADEPPAPADPAIVRKALSLLEADDGAGLVELTDSLDDYEKISLWKEFNVKTRDKMRKLMASART